MITTRPYAMGQTTLTALLIALVCMGCREKNWGAAKEISIR